MFQFFASRFSFKNDIIFIGGIIPLFREEKNISLVFYIVRFLYDTNYLSYVYYFPNGAFSLVIYFSLTVLSTLAVYKKLPLTQIRKIKINLMLQFLDFRLLEVKIHANDEKVGILKGNLHHIKNLFSISNEMTIVQIILLVIGTIMNI